MFRPPSLVLSLYVAPLAQAYVNLIREAAGQWNAGCGVRCEYAGTEAPAAAPPGRTVVVIS